MADFLFWNDGIASFCLFCMTFLRLFAMRPFAAERRKYETEHTSQSIKTKWYINDTIMRSIVSTVVTLVWAYTLKTATIPTNLKVGDLS